jgi:hypothetical protein
MKKENLGNPGDVRPDLRFEPRYRTEDYVVQIMTIEPPAHFEARIMDISGGGLRLRLSMQLVPGDSISIILRSLIVEGKVQYCIENEIGGVDAGLQIRSIHDRPADPDAREI